MTPLATDPPQAPQPAPASQPMPAATPPAQSADEFIQIPKDAFAGIPDGWHGAVRDSQTLKALQEDGWDVVAKQLGMTGHQLLEAYNSADGDPNAPAPQPAQPDAQPPAAPQAATIDQFGQMMDERLKAYREEDQQAAKKSEDAADRKQRMDAENAFANETLKAVGLEPGTKDKPNARHRYASAMFNCELNEIVRADIPEHYSDERRRDALSAPATQSQLDRAGKGFTAAYKDWGNEAVATHAQKLGDEPPTSLAGGPGGGEPPQDFEKMGHKDKAMALTEHMAGRDEE